MSLISSINHAKRFGVFVFGFGLARAALFFSPIILANLLTLNEYGLLEFSQSIATLSILLLGFGLTGTIPLILLRDEVKARWDTLLLLILVFAGTSFVVSLFAALYLSSLFNFYVLAPLMVALLLCQSFWSRVFKSQGKPNSAVFLETGLWLSVLLGAYLYINFGLYRDVIAIILFLYTVVLLFSITRSWFHSRLPFSMNDIKINIRLGIPLMIASAITVLAAASGRAILGIGTDIETVGFYSVLYRVTALPIVAYQVLQISFYKQIYTLEKNTLARFITLIPAGVIIAIIGFLVLVNDLGFLLGERFVETLAQFPLVGKLLLIQTLLWAGLALNDDLNTRAQIAGFVSIFSGSVLVPGFLFLLGAIVYGWGPVDEAPLTFLVIGQSALMAVLYLMQCAAMFYKNNRYLLLWSVTFFGYVGLIGALLITRGLI